MSAGANAIVQLVDDAPAFREGDTATLRRIGLAQLEEILQPFRAAEDDARLPELERAGERIGGLVAAEALVEGFGRATLEEAAARCGLIRDLGAKTVKAAIAAALKRGRKKPADVARSRRAAPQRKLRPRPAAVIESSPSPSSPPSADAAPRVPVPPAVGGESKSSQTGASPKASAGWGAGDRPPPGDDDDEARHMRLAFYPLTDLGNAERFRDRWLGKLLWCPALGWLAWDGKRWSRTGADDLVKIAEHETVRAIQREAEVLRESGDRDADDADAGAKDFLFGIIKERRVMYSDRIAGWGRASEAATKLGALSKRGAPYFAIPVERLDADKFKVNVANGTLTIAKKAEGDYISFGPHNPADLITKMSPVEYQPEAVCPEYDKFIARIQPSDPMRIFLHQWGGLSMTGDVSEQKLAFLYGKGGNGKSVLVDAWSYVAGDYGETVPIETFLDHGKQRGAGQATPDLAILPGVRMLRTSEPERNSKLAEAMVKLVTGGEPIQARHLNRDFFKFYPQFKLTMSGNYRPTIGGADEGIWRRLRLVPFNVSIPKEERDPHLSDKLRLEASGILNRLLDGLRHWCDKGLIEPEDVVQATADYRSDSDPLGRFLSTCVVEAPGQRVQSSQMHEVFEAWCKASGEKIWTNKGMSNAMKERGFVASKSSVTMWMDVKLTKGVSDFVDSHGKPLDVDGDTNREGGAQNADDIVF